MNNTEFPELVNQMTIRGEKLKDIVNLLNFKHLSQASRRLSGKIEWTIKEIEALCEHYNMNFEKLFVRKED